MIALVTDGDITKEADILWRTPEALEPYVRRRSEQRLVDLALLGLCGVELPWVAGPQSRPVHERNQAVGEYCKGECVQACTVMFSAQALPVACRTCPD